MNVAEIGRRHLAQALCGEMKHCDVSEWLDDDGNPVRVYWKPLTGIDQMKIDEGKTDVERTCLVVKTRARDEHGELLFADTPLISLQTDYEYPVLRAIAFLMAMEVAEDADAGIESAEQE